VQQPLHLATKQERKPTMPTYKAHFYTEADWAETDIEAATPAQALQRARQLESDQSEMLDFQSYDSTGGVEHIEVWASDRKTVAEWRSDDLRLRLAARELLDALEQALVALNTAPRFRVPILGVIDSYAVAAICEAAIAKAKREY
jgi:hypothetical protein